MKNQTNITYTKSDGTTSVASASKSSPHKGHDWNTREPVEIYYSASMQDWRIKGSKFFICHCGPCDQSFEKTMLKHGNISQVNEF